MIKNILVITTLLGGLSLSAQQKPGTRSDSTGIPGKQPARSDSSDLRSDTGSRFNSTLDGVIVRSKRPLIEIKPDRTIVNVDASLTNTGSTVLELLEKSPGVAVDRDGNISLKGKQGVQIMIDGKPAYVSGAELTNLLSSMQSNQIDQLEIMTNPPAGYDAAGNGGIINIKTKQQKRKGFNGNLSLSYGQGRYGRTGNSLGLNYRNRRFNFFGSLNNSVVNNFVDLRLSRTYLNAGTAVSVFEQPTYLLSAATNNTLRLGMDYYLSRRLTLGLTTGGFISPRDVNNLSTGYSYKPGQSIDSTVVTTSNIRENWRHWNINLNLQYKIDSLRELKVDMDHLYFTTARDQGFLNETFYPAGPGQQERIKSDLPSDIAIYTFKADYEQQFDKGTKLQTGFKTALVKTDNLADYYNQARSIWEKDYGKSNHFTYQENINSLYANLNYAKDRWSLQAGLRYENTNYRGKQFDNPLKTDSLFSNTYNNFFPTVYISYKADENNQFSLSSGRRIDRPAYQQLNPFLFYINKYTYQQGNAYLRPQYTYNAELSHQYKNKLTTQLGYSHTDGSFNQLFRSEGPLTILTEDNVGKVDIWTLNLSTAQIKINAWWSATLSANLNYKVFNGTGPLNQLRTQALPAQMNIGNQFQFDEYWAAELSGFYNTRDKEGQFDIDGFGQVSAGVSRQLFNKKASIKLTIRDIFFTQVTDGMIYYQNVEEHFRQMRDSRIINLAFTYRFGNNGKEAGRRNSGADEEQNRVRLS